LKTIGKYTIKPYECVECGAEEEHGTNHWSDIYPWCKTCNAFSIWKCNEEIPDGYTTPAKHKSVNLSEVTDVDELFRNHMQAMMDIINMKAR